MTKQRKTAMALVIALVALLAGSAFGQDDRRGVRYRDFGYKQFEFNILSLTTTTPDTVSYLAPFGGTGWFRVYAVDSEVTVNVSLYGDAAAMSANDSLVVPAGQSFGFPIRADSLSFILTSRTGSAQSVYVLAVPHGSNLGN